MVIHPTIRSLMAEIDAFRSRTGMSATAFGVNSLNDPKFVSDLHKGRTPSLSTLDKVKAFMQANDRASAETAA
jgi:hypothetical protein